MLFRPQALNPRELEGRALERWGGFNCGISRNFLLTLGQYNRTTREVSLTDLGRRIYANALPNWHAVGTSRLSQVTNDPGRQFSVFRIFQKLRHRLIQTASRDLPQALILTDLGPLTLGILY